MADDENKPAPLYAQLDQEVDGTFYNTGDEIDAALHAGTREVLKARGDIGGNKPVVSIMPTPAGIAIADMTRDQLLSSIRLEMPIDHHDDERLADMLTDIRAEVADRANADAAQVEGDSDDLSAPKPLSRQTSDELDATAAAEGVAFGDDVKTLADKRKAIQAKRDAPAS